eukprot:sb/3474675/
MNPGKKRLWIWDVLHYELRFVLVNSQTNLLIQTVSSSRSKTPNSSTEFASRATSSAKPVSVTLDAPTLLLLAGLRVKPISGCPLSAYPPGYPPNLLFCSNRGAGREGRTRQQTCLVFGSSLIPIFMISKPCYLIF